MRSITKRLLDTSASGLILLLCSPLMAALAILIRITSGPPVLFRQRRPGLNARPFTLFKFRTMRPVAPNEDEVRSDVHRLTGLGRWMRKYSLDELPQFWNVLRGDMSLVGPRPLLVQYLDRYTPEQTRRHLVKPGITGWAQVRGRNAISWEQRFDLDLWYVDHRSLALDVRILAETVWRVLRREGISREGYETMPEFLGSPRTTSKVK
jgi:sugar transferase EpsL